MFHLHFLHWELIVCQDTFLDAGDSPDVTEMSGDRICVSSCIPSRNLGGILHQVTCKNITHADEMPEQICFIKLLLVLGKHKLHQFCNLSFMLYP